MKDFSGNAELMAVLESQKNTIDFLVKRVNQYAEEIRILNGDIQMLKDTNKNHQTDNKRLRKELEDEKVYNSDKTIKVGDFYITSKQFKKIKDFIEYENSILPAVKLFRELTGCGVKDGINTIKRLKEDMTVPF
jgi:TolA-binding protein